MPGRTARKPLVLVAILIFGLELTAVPAWLLLIRMPGRSLREKPPRLTMAEEALRVEFITHFKKLRGEIGERNLAHYRQLQAAAHYLESELASSGGGVRRDEYEVQARRCYNLQAELPGASPEIVLIGAHYRSVAGSLEAKDNGSGVAALLVLARRFAGSHSLGKG